jgi:hypothetical protein
MNDEIKFNLNRRNFIQKIGLGAAAISAFSLTSCGSTNKLPKDADGNVISGFGGESKKRSKEAVA